MDNEICGGAVEVSETGVSVDEVSSGSVVIAPRVDVNRVSSGAVVIADTVPNRVSVSSGGIIVSKGSVDAKTSSGGIVASSVQELAELLVHKQRHGRMRDMVKAYEKPSMYVDRIGDESKIAKVASAVEEARIRGISVRTDVSLEGVEEK